MEQRIGLDRFTLKLLAVATMLIDHIGIVLFPEVIVLRCIGRLSFPIFAFLTAEGYVHTHSFSKYLRRMALFALLSEIPFDLLRGQLWDPQQQNILLTLCVALLTLRLIDWGCAQSQSPSWGVILMASAAGYAVNALLRGNYSGCGVLMVVLFYLCRQFRWGRFWMLLGMIALNSPWFGGVALERTQVPIQPFAIATLIPLWLYSGQAGLSGPKSKWSFYLFYPLHLLLLEGLRYLI